MRRLQIGFARLIVCLAIVPGSLYQSAAWAENWWCSATETLHTNLNECLTNNGVECVTKHVIYVSPTFNIDGQAPSWIVNPFATYLQFEHHATADVLATGQFTRTGELNRETYIRRLEHQSPRPTIVLVDRPIDGDYSN